eukprot:jgi/Botrbrau1/15621/Bobra.4_1s0009.1
MSQAPGSNNKNDKGRAGNTPPVPPRPQSSASASVVARSAKTLAATFRPVELVKRTTRSILPAPGPSASGGPQRLSSSGSRRGTGEDARVSEEPRVPGVPELNTYIRSKVAGPGFVELLRALGEARSLGEKGHKSLSGVVLPRLALYEVLPATVVAQLLHLTSASADDKRLQRGAYYCIQVLLGSGSAGTPSPLPGPSVQSAAAELPKDVTSRVWERLSGAPDVVTTDLQMRCLAAAARGAEGKLDADLVAAIGEVVNRSAAGASIPFVKKGQKKNLTEPFDLQRIALSAARAALRGKPLRELAVGSFSGITSEDPVGAKHAMALFAAAARLEPAKVMEAGKGLPNLVSSAAAAYESSPHVIGAAAAPPKSSPDKLKGLTGLPVASLQLGDPWGRVALSRLCAALLYADWAGGTDEFCAGIGASFWKMLSLLATREAQDFVALESIRSLFGQLPTAGASLHTEKAETATDGRLRGRAWRFVASRAAEEVVYIPGLQGPENGTLMGAVSVRVRKALRSLHSGPLISSACSTAAAMAEARVRAGKGGGASVEAAHALALIAEELLALLQTVTTPPLRFAALNALLWAQVAGATNAASPAMIVRQVSGDGGSPTCSQDLLHALLASLLRMLRAAPQSAPFILSIAVAAVAASPANAKAEEVVELWNAALGTGAAGKEAALQSALQLLAAPPTPPTTSGIKGLSQTALAKAGGEEASWAALQRAAAWWLGEHACPATGEAVGAAHPLPSDGYDSDPQPEPLDGPLISAAETTGLQALRNPQLASVISHLQHVAASSSWPLRVASAQALAKVAVRSDEPYRLYCFAWLAGHAASSPFKPEAAGVWAVARSAVPVLNSLYSTNAMLEALATRYGDLPSRWPPAVLRAAEVSPRCPRHPLPQPHLFPARLHLHHWGQKQGAVGVGG